MTGRVAISGTGSGPFTVTYYLAQAVTSLQVTVKAADGSVVATLPAITSGAQLTAGLHNAANNPVIWDGGTDANPTAGAIGALPGNYFAVISTTAAQQTTKLAKLAGPFALTDPQDSARNNGRWSYNPAVNRNSGTAAHNRVYIASADLGAGATQLSGLMVADPDGTPYATRHNAAITFGGSDISATDWFGVGLTDDGAAILGGQGAHRLPMLSPDLGSVTIFPRGTSIVNSVNTRTIQAFGTAAAPRLYFLDNGSTTGLSNGGGVSYLDLSPADTDVPVKVVDTNSYSGSGQSFVVNKTETAIWVAEVSGTAVASTKIEKFIRASGTGPGPGSAVWVRDPTFVFALPTVTVAYTATTQIRGIALSPDESVLWYTISDAATATNLANKQLVGVNSSTGASLGANYQVTATDATFGNPTGISVSDSGNIFLLGFSATYSTQTNSGSLYVFSPPDPNPGGTSDVTASPLFSVGAATLNLIGAPTVTPTYQSAVVSWDTDFCSDSKLEYGTAPDALTKSVVPAPNPLDTHHSVAISGLNQVTTYYYRVTSAAAGLPSVVATGSFATPALTFTSFTPTTGENSVTFNYATSDYSNTLINYGAAPGVYFKSISASAQVGLHTATVTGLQSGRTYYYIVTSGSGVAGTTASVSGEQMFTVTDNVTFSNLQINSGPTQAVLTFDTNIPCHAVMKFGPSSPDSDPVTDAGDNTAHHSYTFSAYTKGGVSTPLSTGATYFYAFTTHVDSSSIADRTTPWSLFTTVAAGVPATTSQSAAADVKYAHRVNIDPADGTAIARLAIQGVPATPIAGTVLPAALSRGGVVAYGGYLYYIGGNNNATAQGAGVSTVYYAPLDASTGAIGAWQHPAGAASIDLPTATLPTGTGEKTWINDQCFGYNGFIYAVSGVRKDNGGYDVAVLYSKQNADGSLSLPAGKTPQGNSLVWAKASADLAAPAPLGFGYGSARVADGWCLISGGTRGGVIGTNNLARIKPDGDFGSWSSVRSLIDPKWYQRTFVNAHTVYSVGGQLTSNSPVAATDVQYMLPDRDLTPPYRTTLDPNHGTDAYDLGGHFAGAMDLCRGKIINAGGRFSSSAGTAGTTAISYTKLGADGLTGTWKASGMVLPAALFDFSGAYYNGNLYTVGGRTDTATISTSTAAYQIPINADPAGGYAYSGTFESQFIDLNPAGGVTNLRHLTIAGTSLTASNIEVRYRYGITTNVTDWLSANGLDVDITGGARYFQYQIVLKGDGTSTPEVTGATLTTGSAADLSITNSVDKPTAVIGDTVTYTVTVSNAGPDDAAAVVVTDNLPAGLSFVSATGGIVSGSGAVKTITIGNVPAGGSAVVSIAAVVTDAAPGASALTNTVTESFGGADSSSGNDSASASFNLPAITTGAGIPGRFGPGTLLASQTVPTKFGDNLSELDQLFGKSDGGNLRLGITGNIENNSQNGIMVLLDTKAGGVNPFAYAGTDGGERLKGLVGDTLDDGFAPDYALDLNDANGTLYADLYDLQAGTKTYLGAAVDGGSPAGLTGGGELAFNNSNIAGVTDSSAASAATATTGVEFSLPLSRIGSPAGAVKVMTLVQANGDYHSNQTLPGLPDTSENLGSGDQNYAAIPGRQYVAMTPAYTANDLSDTETPWTFEDRIFSGDISLDSHPAIVSIPTAYDGRFFVVEDVEHAGGAHTGNVIAVTASTGVIDTTFGVAGRVAISAPVTGRVAVRAANGVMRLYLAAANGDLYSMNETDGGDVHTLSLGGSTSSTPAVVSTGAESVIYLPVKTAGAWYLTQVTDGATMSLTAAPIPLVEVTDITSSPSLNSDGSRVQIGGATATGGVVYTISSDLSTVFTAAVVANAVKAPPTLASDSSVFFVGDAPASGNGAFYCFNASNGNPVASFGTAGAVAITGGLEFSAFADYSVGGITNALYFATSAGQLNAVTPVTGASLSGYPASPLGIEPATGSALLLNGNLYVPTAKGVFAVPASDPTSYVRFPLATQVATTTSTGRAAGSASAAVGSTGLLYGLKVQ
jgi:uncharacterized repeat protein (TIGR01451 family)